MTATKVIITVDTEISTYCRNPLNILDMVYGKIGNEYFGIDLIMRLCDEKGFKATFFIDVYACKAIGEDAWKEVCQKIASAGHDVQLHTHPFWAFDRNRVRMLHYSLEEQKDILNFGREMIHKWTGKYPVAHRAGDFGANYDTLEALAATGFQLDSSMLYQWPLCRLNDNVFSKNAVCRYRGILKLPVSVYCYFRFGRFELCRAFDVDANTHVELKKALKEAHRLNIDPVVIMMHSFSFIKWNKDHTKHKVNHGDVQRFRQLLDFLSGNPDFEVITMRGFYEHVNYTDIQETVSADPVPYTGLRYALWRIIVFRNANWKNKTMFVFLLAVILLICFFSGAFLY